MASFSRDAIFVWRLLFCFRGLAHCIIRLFLNLIYFGFNSSKLRFGFYFFATDYADYTDLYLRNSCNLWLLFLFSLIPRSSASIFISLPQITQITRILYLRNLCNLWQVFLAINGTSFHEPYWCLFRVICGSQLCCGVVHL